MPEPTEQTNVEAAAREADLLAEITRVRLALVWSLAATTGWPAAIAVGVLAGPSWVSVAANAGALVLTVVSLWQVLRRSPFTSLERNR